MPAFGVLWSALFLSESITSSAWMGLVLITLGIAAAIDAPRVIVASTPRSAESSIGEV